MITVTPGIRSERSLSYETGALIVVIQPDLESLIGLRAGDVILQIDRRRIESAEQAAEVLRQASGRVAVYVERNGEVVVRRLLFRGPRG